MIDKRIVETIGVDADDTLWESNNFYIDVSEKFYEIMRRYCSDAEIRAAFVAREEDNIAELGYGAKAVILSMIETAIISVDRESGDRRDHRRRARVISRADDNVAQRLRDDRGIAKEISGHHYYEGRSE